MGSSYNSETTQEDGDLLMQGIKLPKLPNIVALERASLEKFIGHFKLVSKIVIFNLSVSVILLLIFFLLFCYDLYLFHMVVLFPKLYDTLLLLVVFFYSVATLTYIYMTLSLVDEGHYSAGVWLSGYSCGFGLLCCLLATMCPGWHSRAQLLTNDTLSYTPIDDLSPLLRSDGLTSSLNRPLNSSVEYMFLWCFSHLLILISLFVRKEIFSFNFIIIQKCTKQ